MGREIQTKVSVNGSMEKALEVARETLVRNNFRLLSTTSTSFEAEGPGMHSTGQNPLVGISRVRLEAIGHDLLATAELGGLRRMVAILFLLIGGLTVMCVLMAIFKGPSAESMSHSRLLVAVGPTAPWLVLAPLMIWWMRRRIERALETLLSNASAVANAAGRAARVGQP